MHSLSRLWRHSATLVIIALALASVAGHPAAAQEPEVGIIGVAYVCPTAVSDPDTSTCDTVAGVSIEVLVNGTEIAGSPFTSALNSIGFNSIEFNAPADAEITLTQVGGIPDGYEPAAGSDPFVANVADLPIGGAGGESTSPYAELVNVPVDDVAELPDTGTGRTSGDPADNTLIAVLAAAAAALVVTGSMIARAATSHRR